MHRHIGSQDAEIVDERNLVAAVILSSGVTPNDEHARMDFRCKESTIEVPHRKLHHSNPFWQESLGKLLALTSRGHIFDC